MYNSKLVINQIIPEDDAIYQCMAENDQGSILSMARLIVVMSEDRPSTPRNVRPETVSSSAILLAWDRPLYNSDKVIAYSVHYMKAEGLNNEEYQVVIGNETTRYIIDDLEPASNYTFYIVAYMPMGASRMSDHVSQHTFEDVPLRAPEISLTSRSPTDIQVSWLPIPAKFSRGRIVTYRLSYRVSSESAINTLEIPGAKSKHLIEGLDPDTIYLLRIAAATKIGWGEQSVWTSHRTPKASSAKVPMAPELRLEPLNCTTILVSWQPPPVNTANIQGYRLFYWEDSQQESMPIQLRAHDSHRTIGGLAPSSPPLGVKVTLIEDDTALVSWKQPDEPNTVVTRYTILYASRKAWIGGEWQVLQREGTITMALLENLLPGNVYLIKISASNEVGDGPFSNAVELAVQSKGIQSSQKPKRSDGSTEARAYSDGFYHLDQKSMTGIIVGVCIALTCIMICVLILIYRSKARKSSASKMAQQGNGQVPQVSVSLANGSQAESAESFMPVVSDNFIDAKGGTGLIINSAGPVNLKPTKKKWLFFTCEDKPNAKKGQAQRRLQTLCSYQPGTTMLTYEEEPPTSLQVLFGPMCDTDHSNNSEGSHETGDSGRYSHDEMEMTQHSSVGSSRPPSLEPFTGNEEGLACDEPSSGPPHFFMEIPASASSQPQNEQFATSLAVFPL
ncbi:Protogenin [Acipenser ruthenus]|uniref:Protogenin n=1 Tax=Acipenser ruthenus TaxID=7906 RepID=A0A444V2F6_ACIRT|nr:Protogenin [Acipenser ruthenus]